jgi:hypothetical protein
MVVVGLVILALALWAVVYEWRTFLAGKRQSPGGLGFALLVMAFMFFVYYPWQLYHSFKKRTRLSLPVTIRLESGQITVSNELSTSQFHWSEIERVLESRHVYLLCDDAGPLIAIPKRFASPAQLEALEKYLEARGVAV